MQLALRRLIGAIVMDGGTSPAVLTSALSRRFDQQIAVDATTCAR